MALPQGDPSLPSLPVPLFSDIDAARGDHLRGNNQAIWENLEYLNAATNVNDATAKTTPVDADTLLLKDSAASFALKKLTIENLRALLTPAGSYLNHAGATAPTGFLACNAAAVSRTTYATLFAVIGTTYGAGDGSTTFNLPDARGLVMVGAGANGTRTRADASAFDGGTVGASRDDQMQGHYHSVGLGDNGGIYSSFQAGVSFNIGNTTGSASDDGTNGAPRTGNETRPAEIAVLVCIKF